MSRKKKEDATDKWFKSHFEVIGADKDFADKLTDALKHEVRKANERVAEERAIRENERIQRRQIAMMPLIGLLRGKPHEVVEQLGMLPTFLDLDDPRPAREQFNDKYVGGWFPTHNDKARLDTNTLTYFYPGDPPMKPFAFAILRDEKIVFYQFAFVAIIQRDGSYEIARMD